ncbi:MAG TPA: Gfo/Idh/MocA family oxidoreductase [Methylomirabilota bacterium]|nr:Gfo/Idh/MocA family oxidoreductase [Methylomirabilota bacterium]
MATSRTRPSERRSDTPLRVGLVGAGMISYYHLVAWSRQERARVVAVCDPQIERAQQRAVEFGIPAAYDGIEAMLDKHAIDAVDIASPRETHAAMVDVAAARGIDALCQKPLTPTLAEAVALAERVADTIRLMVHENWRFRPWYRALGQWLAAGDLGEVQYAAMTMLSSGLVRDAGGQFPDLVRQPFMAREKRLMIAEVLIHHLDVVRWLCGPLRVVASRTAHTVPEVDGETQASIFLETATGAPVIVGGTLAAPGYGARTGDRLEIVGTKASALLDGCELALLGPTPRQESFVFERDYQASFDGAIGHFVDCLESGAAFETDVLDNIETLRLVDRAYAAASAGGGP